MLYYKNYRKSTQVFIFLLMFWSKAAVSPACVGNTIVIGTSDSPEDLLTAELAMQIINERTGSATKMILLGNYTEAENKLVSEDDSERVDILFQEHAQSQLGFTLTEEGINDKRDTNFLLKRGGRSFGVWRRINVWNTSAQLDNSILLNTGLLSDFPLLPRLLNKLKRILADDSFSKLVNLVKTGEKARNVAHRVLKEKELI